jgi:hypothetical protein
MIRAAFFSYRALLTSLWGEVPLDLRGFRLRQMAVSLIYVNVTVYFSFGGLAQKVIARIVAALPPDVRRGYASQDRCLLTLFFSRPNTVIFISHGMPCLYFIPR